MRYLLMALLAIGFTTPRGWSEPAKGSRSVMTKVPNGDLSKGKEVFGRCASCHSSNTTEAKYGPSLKGLYAKARMKNGQKPTDETVLHVINEGLGSMPAYGQMLSAPEKANLVAYLRSL